jgi:hypothetical protein
MAAAPLTQAQVDALIQAAIQQQQGVIQGLQQQLQAMQQQQQQQLQAPAPAYVVNPGAGNQPWDFLSPAGIKLHSCATAAIEPIYDGEEDKLAHFLGNIAGRAKTYGLMGVLRVPTTAGAIKSIVTEHGCITIAQAQTAAQIYLAQQGRERQAADMLATLICNSTTPRFRDTLRHRSADYVLNVPGQGDPVEDGPCMLLSLIQLVNVDTRAVVATVLDKLNNMRRLMEEAKSHIPTFNAKVQSLIDELNARDAPIPDLIPQLFAAYRNCEDQEFVLYFKVKQGMYLDRSINLTYMELLRLAIERYKNIGEDWGQKSESQLEFIAMQTELKQLRQNAKKTTDKKQVPRSGGNTNDNKNKGKWAWKGIAPKEGEPHDKKVDGKTYIYCPHHGDTKWVLETNAKGIKHKTGCTKNPDNKQKTDGGGMIAAVANLEETEVDEEENL